jgi:hypothetical protein
LIKTQVGAATSMDMLHLTRDAESHCDLIADHTFWEGLKHIVGDIELKIKIKLHTNDLY